MWRYCAEYKYTYNVPLALNVHVLKDANFMFAVTNAPFVFFTGQPRKKGVLSPDTEKMQIKHGKDAAFVDLSPSAPSVTNVLSVVEGISVGA